MRKVLFCILIVFCIPFSLLAKLLQFQDIHTIMNQILEQHVEQKSITPQIIQNALILYINQFDPDRIYLLEEELLPFTNLSVSELNSIEEQYKHEDFSIFKDLNQVVQKAIYRSRAIRQYVEQEQDILVSFPSEELKKLFPNFSKDETELKARIISQIVFFLKKQQRAQQSKLTFLEQKQFLKSYETQLRNKEDTYLYQTFGGKQLSLSEQNHFFVLHILKALASSLDAHTSFYDSEEAHDLQLYLQKEFCGVGLHLEKTSEGIVVTKILEGTPAFKNRMIRKGDVLLAIDGKAINNFELPQIIALLHREDAIPLKLTFQRKQNENLEKPFEVELIPAPITMNTDRFDVGYEVFADGILGKITLNSFYQGEDVSSERDVKNAIQELQKKGKLKGLILDLRNNRGGFLSQAVKVAGLFIKSGVIVIAKYSNGEKVFYRDIDGKISYKGPLIVLTSRLTASAAEITAQALQDYGIALIAGDETTYGKGTIQKQTVTNSKGLSHFKVTVGEYYGVSGQTPQQKGVISDILVPSLWNKEEIGEKYVSSLNPQPILAAYEDTLEDVEPSLKGWYLNYYIPSLQHRQEKWHKMLPILRKNSEYRIAHNKNYQFYLKEGELSQEDLLGDSPSFGEDDIQIEEAFNILKDMIYLDKKDRSTQDN